MKITMRTLCAGPNGTMRAGITYDVAEAFGTDLVAGGFAKREDDDDGDLEVEEIEVVAPSDETPITEQQDEEITIPRGRRRSGPRDAEPEEDSDGEPEA